MTLKSFSGCQPAFKANAASGRRIENSYFEDMHCCAMPSRRPQGATATRRKVMREKSKPTRSTARVVLTDAKLHGDETIETPIGPIELTNSYFDDAASKRLY